MKEISRSLLSAELDRQSKILEGLEKTLKSAGERVINIEVEIGKVKTVILHLSGDLGETESDDS